VGCQADKREHTTTDSRSRSRRTLEIEKAPWPVTALALTSAEQDALETETETETETLPEGGPDNREKLRFPNPREPFPAQIYGNLKEEACLRELSRRQIGHMRVAKTNGVATPIRLKGRLHGVDVHGDRPNERERSPYEILDCRLALALDDFTIVLAAHDIVEAVHMSMYRPPTAPLEPGKHRGQHEAALAIDLGILIRSDGSHMVVENDFRGRIGAKTCGVGAGPNPVTEAATELRDILCTAVSARTFSVYLTPNHDAPHHNHFHLEVTRHVTWLLVE
jgi:hypothetical protein